MRIGLRLYLSVLLFRAHESAGFVVRHDAASAGNGRLQVRDPSVSTCDDFNRRRVLMRLAEDELKEEAQRLLERAQELRASIPESKEKVASSESTTEIIKDSPWSVSGQDDVPGVGYRFYIDIGREEGTWMDPRWGASGKRIEFTLDVKFLTGEASIADDTVRDTMVKDNFGGKSSPVCILQSAEMARLRGGFERMKCYGGGYRIDSGKTQTARFFINVEGTPESGSVFGDVSVPKGALYFSLPCFGNISNLSTKEGIVSVRQVGWHTGWRREESRIAGVVRAVPIETARKRDAF